MVTVLALLSGSTIPLTTSAQSDTAPEQPSGLSTEAGDTQVRLTWKDPGNASITKYQVLQFPESIKLISSDHAKLDKLGWSVAVDGDTLVIGALGGDPDNTGAAYVFTRDARGWSQVGKLTAAVRRNDAGFGYGVAVHGDTIVVGAYEDDIEGDDAGAAYVFTRPANGWADMTQTARLTAGSDAADGDEFGKSVAVHGDTIVVGAPEQGADAEGAAYIFTKPANGWADGTETAKLSGDGNGDRFGRSVAVHGDTIVVGSNDGDDAKGEAYVFTKSAVTGVWDDWDDKSASNATARLTASARANNDYFGRSVAVEGETIVVGAPYDDNKGSAHVFSKPDGGWTSTSTAAKLTASVGTANDQFGFSVALDGNTVVVGADQDDSSRGSVYVFTKPQDGWTDTEGKDPLTAYDRSQNDRFGNFVAVDGDTVLVGAVGDDSDKGSAYVFGTGEWADTAPARLTVTGYQYTDNGGSDWNNISGSDSGTVSYTVSGLMVGTRTFAVRAVNSGTLLGLSSVSRDVTIVDAPRRPTGLGTTAGDTQATVQWRVPSSENDPPPIDKYQLLQIPISTLTADDRAANDEFGYSVAIDGNTAVVGAYHRDVGVPVNVGVAYVFTKDSDDAWSQAATLTASDGAANDEFGISVAVDGDTILVGAHQNDSNKGAAYIFTKFSGVWGNASVSGNHRVETAKLVAADGAADDEFGISVALDGDTAVIGAHQDDDNGNQSGSAYIFTKDSDDAWSQAATLTASDGAANDELGISVAVHGDTVVVGAHQPPYEEDGEIIEVGPGAAYVFIKPDTGGWANEPSKDHRTESARLTAPDGGADDEFGISVAINVDTVVVGAHKHDANGNSDAGAAYVFTRDSNSGKWSEASKLTASNGDPGDGFGISVAVDGNTAVVGAYLDDRDAAARDTGSTYVFARKLGVWSETLNLAGPYPGQSPRLGYSVAVSNDTVLAGVPQDYGSRGSAYAMDISTAEWVDFVSKELTMSDDDEYYVYRMLNLTNDQQYAFRVRSVNAAANRPSAETVAATPMLAKPGRTEGLSAKAGNRRVTLSWDDPRDSSLTGYQVLQPTEQIKLTAGSDGETNGEFGESVAVDDGTAVVGAPEHDGTDSGGNAITDSGAAYVFTRNPNSGAWSDPIELTAGSDGAANDWFGYSVAVDGDTIVIGAYQPRYQDGNEFVNVGPGVAYVFTRDPHSGAWSEPVKLIASDGAVNDWFGYSVAVHEGVIVVGARDHNGKAGAAYVFTKPENDPWANDPNEDHRTQTAKLTASGGAGFDYFGQSVAVHGKTIVVGARGNTENPGVAYVFTEPESGWDDANVLPTLTAADADNDDQFGYSVAVDGNTVVVGALKNNSAYVFIWDSGAWSQAAKLAASDSDGSENFGASVAIRGSTILVGAYAANIDVCDSDDCDDDPRSGAAYFFTKPANVDWVNDPNKDHRTESGKLILPTGEGAVEKSDEFGNSVALDGQSIMVGAPQDAVETDDDNFGSVYVSDIPQWAFLASGAETTSATVGGLTNGVEYAFQVRAVDDTGEGPPSDIVRATPKPAPAAPTNFRATPRSASARLAWDDPNDSSITRYEYRQASVGGNFGPATKIPGSSATTKSYTVRNLTNRLTYRFQVRAVNVYGAGDWSPSLNVTPRAPNRAPYFIIGSDTVTFTVDENTSPGSLVGDAVAATDPDGDVLTYSLLGTDASSFVLDGSTGQITTRTLLDYETQSQYSVLVRVRDGEGGIDSIEVSIDVSNVDEAGTVSVSPEQPEVGTALVVSLSDLDGLVSDIFWQWARSSDGSDWSDISGANSDSYTPVADDVGIYLQATASYTDGHGPGKSAHAVMERQTAQRGPSFEGDVTLTIDENTPSGSLVGDAITATDPDGDVLTYSLSGTDASSFVLDGSTGEITVGSGTLLDYESGPTRYTVVVSVHDGRGAYGNDDISVDDLIEVSIDVSNVDEAGTVSVSPEQPEVGTALVVSLSDPDGSVSDIFWQWARSSDGSDWSDISGANSDSYTPVADDVGIYLQATASYTDGHGPGKSAHAVMERQTAQRGPSFEGDVTLTIDENTPSGSLVGDAITATDPDGDVLTYSLSGTDASSFVLDGSTGEITVGSGTLLDYESGPTRYTVVVSVHDGRGAYGNDDISVDDLIEVSIDVSNVDEAGTVSVSPEQPEVGTALVVSLSDPDGSVSDIFWQWARSSDRTDWQDMAGASSFTYTPVDLDADKYLRVIASYADGEGSGKQAQAVFSNVVQALPDQSATSTPEPTPTTVPSRTPAAPPLAPVDDSGASLWWIILLAAGAVAAAAGMYIIARNRSLR